MAVHMWVLNWAFPWRGVPSVDLLDAERKVSALLTLATDDRPTLLFFDKRGKVIWGAP